MSHQLIIFRKKKFLQYCYTGWYNCILACQRPIIHQQTRDYFLGNAPCCCLPTPVTLASGGVRCSLLWSTSQLLRPSGQQYSHSGGVCPQIQGDNVVRMWVKLKRCVCECYRGALECGSMLYVCVRGVMDVVFCLYCDAWSCRCSCMGSMSVSPCRCCYVCVLCVSCGSYQC